MSSFNPKTTSQEQRPRLRLPGALWKQLLAGLQERGGGVRESGAFLLGEGAGAERVVTSFVLYDDLDPNCLNDGYIRFDGRHYGRLWEQCARNQVGVVADVHTHPFGPGQSDLDRAHPMVSIPGHVALIVPYYALRPVATEDIGVYVYRGRYRWRAFRGRAAARVLDIQKEGVKR